MTFMQNHSIKSIEEVKIISLQSSHELDYNYFSFRDLNFNLSCDRYNFQIFVHVSSRPSI